MYSKSGLNFNKSFWSLYTFLVRFWFSNFAYILCWHAVSCMLLPPEIKCYNLIFQSKSGFFRFSISILPELARSFVSLNIYILICITFDLIFCDVLNYFDCPRPKSLMSIFWVGATTKQQQTHPKVMIKMFKKMFNWSEVHSEKIYYLQNRDFSYTDRGKLQFVFREKIPQESLTLSPSFEFLYSFLFSSF